MELNVEYSWLCSGSEHVLPCLAGVYDKFYITSEFKFFTDANDPISANDMQNTCTFTFRILALGFSGVYNRYSVFPDTDHAHNFRPKEVQQA
jgi:hypothetical protein